MAQISMQSPENRWYKKWWVITLFGIASFFLMLAIAFGFYIFDLAGQINRGEIDTPSKQTTKEQIYDAAGIDNYFLGSVNPRVTIVIFSDFACPYCRESYSIIRELIFNHPDIKVIFRDFPLHDESPDLAMAARCAGEQNLFWPMHDKLFQNQGVTTEEEFNKLANQVGVKMDKYQDCFTNKKYINKIQKDYIDGQRLGVEGTPTWFFNGHKLTGNLSMNNIEKIINEIK